MLIEIHVRRRFKTFKLVFQIANPHQEFTSVCHGSGLPFADRVVPQTVVRVLRRQTQVRYLKDSRKIKTILFEDLNNIAFKLTDLVTSKLQIE